MKFNGYEVLDKDVDAIILEELQGLRYAIKYDDEMEHVDQELAVKTDGIIEMLENCCDVDIILESMNDLSYQLDYYSDYLATKASEVAKLYEEANLIDCH